MANNNSSSCFEYDKLGFYLPPLYKIFFITSCVTLIPGIAISLIYLFVVICRYKTAIQINNHCLFLNYFIASITTLLHSPLRLYFYKHNGCSPRPGSALCYVYIYANYAPSSMSQYLTAQISVERIFLILKPFVFRRGHILPIYLHYMTITCGLLLPSCFYASVLWMSHTAITGQQRERCDLEHQSDILDDINLIIEFAPYLVSLVCYPTVIGVFIWKKLYNSHGSSLRQEKRMLWQLNLHLIWFLSAFSPWVLYYFIEHIFNIQYSVFIDECTMFVVNNTYAFSSLIFILTSRELKQFCIKHLTILYNTARGRPTISSIYPLNTITQRSHQRTLTQ